MKTYPCFALHATYQKNVKETLQTCLQHIPSQLEPKRRLWLTADEHYNHEKILHYMKRPFSSVEEMNRYLVSEHNKHVGAEDWTIHIGDFLFGDAAGFAEVLAQLNGHHAFLEGNHDSGMKKYFAYPFKSTRKVLKLPNLYEFSYNHQTIVLCHYSLHTWRASHYNSLHFFGHSHGKIPAKHNCRDVGVDTNEFKPLQIETAISSLPLAIS